MQQTPPARRSARPPAGRWPDELTRGRPITIVSNRQPYRHEYADDGNLAVDRPTGGLTAALDPVMQRLGGTWIAWGDGAGDDDVVDSGGVVPVPPGAPSYQLKRVWLSPEQVHDYYDGYSNQVLWPICHAALTNVRCDPGFWRRYREVNERFADAVVEQADREPLVWFQDYHLALAPAFARPRLPDDATLLHFWHIPWAPWDTFRACPHGRTVLEALLENDVLGFHVPRYRTNFLGCVDAALDAHIDWTAGRVEHGGSTTTVTAIPMGVPVDRIQQMAAPMTVDSARDVRRSYGIGPETRLAVGVDRFDYTKGIVERLRALEHLWERIPGWQGELTYVQVGSESRSRIPAYQAIQTEIAAEIDRINRRFGRDGWQPIVSLTSRLSETALCELYRAAGLALVSPLRDGMNLVAQEYVAAQVTADGVLVLSDQVGIHDRLGAGAVSVTPADIEGFAAAIDRALTMPRHERRQRMRWLRSRVMDRDLSSWLTENLRATAEDRPVER